MAHSRNHLGGRIDGETRLLGLIGHGIAHTWSPVIHNTAAREFGINQIYLPIDLPGERIKDFLDLAWDMGAVGFNVTVPHKELVAGLVKGHNHKSVNTIYRGDEGWQATSTDGAGFAHGLRRISQEIEDYDHIVFLGSGGAVIAIGEYLKEQKIPARVDILRRNPTRDLELQAVFSGGGLHDFTLPSLQSVVSGSSRHSLIVQASSAPLHGESLAELSPGLEGFQGSFYDLVYGQPSQLYFQACSLGLKALDGEAMLIEQARCAQKKWWGRSAPYETLLQAIHGKES